jgi:putative membrane protein
MQPGEAERPAERGTLSRPSGPISDPRVYLAAERTFLAWIRTSVSLMGLGFVVARFALWTRDHALSTSPGSPVIPTISPTISTWLGFGMVCVGVFVSVYAAARHREYVRSLEQGVANPPLPVKTSLIVAALLAAVGLAIAVNILMI